MRIGAHLTISQGFPAAARLAADIGANTFAYFTRNPRGGAARAIPEEEIEAWRSIRRELDLFPIVGHMPYVVNMAAREPRVHEFAKMVVREDLERAHLYGGEFLVCHPGSHQGDGVEVGIRRIVEVLEEGLRHARGTVFCLEGMAGSGSEVGYEFGQLAAIFEALGWPEALGVCLDTCHLFGAGYDFTPQGLERLKNDLADTVGLERVRVVHLNDSLKPQGSHRDRHARLGQGLIGRDQLVNFVTDPVFGRLPMIIETPVSDYKEYGEEIRRLRSWLDEDA
jgi:deoxyribonuclease-4